MQLRLSPHYLGPDITYPVKANKLCPEHLPTITPHRVLGAHVAVPVEGKFAEGVISDLGRGGLAVSNPEIDTSAGRQTLACGLQTRASHPLALLPS